VRAKLKAIAEALGIEDSEMAVERVAELMGKAKELQAVMPELDGLRAAVKKAEEEAAETDVDQAIASRKLGPEVKPALLMHRKADPAGFAKAFPKTAAAPASALSRSIASTPGGGELRVSPDGAQVLRAGARGAPPGEVLKVDGVVNLALFPGANPTDRAMTYLSGRYPGWDKLTHDQRFTLACNFKRQPNVIHETSAAA
jgi:hypothetical protein